MIKKLTCIECPVGCNLEVDVENCRAIKVSGNNCPKGEKYATSEIENPSRVFTSIVLAKNLALRMIPVRTDKPIPKPKIFEAMREVKKLIISSPVKEGDVIVNDFLGTGADLIATRECLNEEK